MSESTKIIKNSGTTAAERYLARLCERTFLSLWSYPNVIRDEFLPGTRTGKEVCDLLVVFDDDIVIFSDKDCEVPRTGNLQLDWTRWFRKAVLASAKQIHGAERWFRRFPERLFLDQECRHPLPVTPRITPRTRIHRIVVAHKIAARCREELGGSGSLMLLTDIRGSKNHEQPFMVGDLDPGKGFVHVLDDVALDVLLHELDTMADFAAYLNKKEEVVRSGVSFFAAGEEELLSWYLRHHDGEGHFIKLPDRGVSGIVLEEGHFHSYLRSRQRTAKVQADEISYEWDQLIERFSHHALQGTQYYEPPGGITDTEVILRWLAREPRVRRRMLARKLVDCVLTTPPHLRRTAVILPSSAGDPFYVFLMIPWNGAASARVNRELRMSVLIAACEVVRWKFPEAVDVVGVASESGNDSSRRTEDAIYCDFRTWTEEQEQDARRSHEELGLLASPSETRWTEHEFPVNDQERIIPVGRNDPCPCGSGRKYKKCHGRHPSEIESKRSK